MEVDKDSGNKMTLNNIMVTIFESCDEDKTDSVQVSELIDIINPFFPVENWSSLDELRRTLDPEDKNIYVNSARFYEVMRQWAKKIELAAKEEELNNSGSSVNAKNDNKEEPLTHSTPNVSGYSLSTSQYEQPEVDNAEEIKKLEHRLETIYYELRQTKAQLIATEELNEVLDTDMAKLNQKLHAEQHIIKNLQKDKQDNEELREELDDAKAKIEALKKELVRCQKDSSYYESQAKKIENERTIFEGKLNTLTKQKKKYLEELENLRAQLKAKEYVLEEFIKSHEELKHKLSEQQDVIDELQEENWVLSYKKGTLEEATESCSHSLYHSLGELLVTDSTPSDTSQEFSIPPPLNVSTQLQISHHYSSPEASHLKSNLKSPVLITHTSSPNNDAAILHFCIGSIGLNSDGEPETVEENIYFELKPGNPNDQSRDSLNFEIRRVFEKDQSGIRLSKFENNIFKLQFESPERQYVHYVSDIKYFKMLNEEVTLNAELTNQLQFSNATIAKLEKLLDVIKNKLTDAIQNSVNPDRLKLAEFKETLGKNVQPLALEVADSRFKFSTRRNDNMQTEIVSLEEAKPVMKHIFGKIDQAENNNDAENIYMMIENNIQYTDKKDKENKELVQAKDVFPYSKQKMLNELAEFNLNRLPLREVDLNQSNGITLDKSPISGRADIPDFPSVGIQAISLAPTEKLSVASDFCLEVPSLDVKCFADDLLRNFSFDGGLSRQNLTMEEEKKLSDLLSHLLANSNKVEKQLKALSERYHLQYKNMVMMARDVSYHLRDRDTRNAETIVQAYDSLKEIMVQLKQLVQHASQIGALTCENRELPFRVWAINYTLKQNHHSRSRENQSTQTLARRRILEYMSYNMNDEYIPERRSKVCCCITTFIFILFAMALVLCIMLGINYHCRETVSESVSCPLDGLFDHVFNEKLPM